MSSTVEVRLLRTWAARNVKRSPLDAQETLFGDFVLRTTPLPTTNSLIPLLSSHTKILGISVWRWYSSILTSYANQVLSVASSTFSGGVSLFGKLPLLYPWPRLRSYPYELTA
ncbi:hypothetical protein HID58_088042, partial [Brassica napus]